ncbi:MAG TPA: SIS domain-containing protein [Opitutales bacterium]|jgi:D-sedoheptulose 7-phosphate isomerase|nr:SIS domain-containing protein [Opitutales bacterium]
MESLKHITQYAGTLAEALRKQDWAGVDRLVLALQSVQREGLTVYLCGNGGSAANAVHWANDLVYPLAKTGAKALRCIALPANVATLTCLANDLSYEQIFSFQLQSAGAKGDVLIALSGSGNSPNVLRALEVARERGMICCAIVGFDGGQARQLADIAIHFPVHDMQIAEDLQMIVCHMVMRQLCRPE